MALLLRILNNFLKKTISEKISDITVKRVVLSQKIIEKNTEYFEKHGKYVIKLDAPAIDISSTQLRAMIRSGEDASRYIDSEVLAYIEERGLYK